MNTISDCLRCGYVAIIGKPNTGKSTILNTFLKRKISIISKRKYTTQSLIHGVLTNQKVQYIFIDTPGVYTLNKEHITYSTLSVANVILYIVETNKWSAYDTQIISSLPKTSHVIVVINKIDKIIRKTILLPFMLYMKNQSERVNLIIPVSAKTGYQFKQLLNEIALHLPAQEHYFEENCHTHQPISEIVAEYIREKIFHFIGCEIPYCCTVTIVRWREDDETIFINAEILVQKSGHKKILLGKNGSQIKKIVSLARNDIVNLTGKLVYLEVHVKCKKT